MWQIQCTYLYWSNIKAIWEDKNLNPIHLFQEMNLVKIDIYIFFHNTWDETLT